MAKGANLLQWRDRNWAEHGHYIYRSQSPMNPNSLPSPIGQVDKNITEYIDYDVTEGEKYYYRIAAFRNNDIVVSDEIELVAEPLDFGIGPDDFIGGDLTHGFFGELSANEFITGDDLASQLGITQGTSQHSNTPWLKFALNDEIIYIPQKPIRHSISWEHIYQAGAVYGTGDNGLAPSGGNRIQDAMVSIDGYDFKVTLLKGANSDPVPTDTIGYDIDWTHGSEWNKLMYPIHNGVHKTSSNPSNPSEPYNQWASYTEADLLVDYRDGNGSYSWTQEQHPNSSGSTRVNRGYGGVTSAGRGSATNNNTGRGWRPALRLIR